MNLVIQGGDVETTALKELAKLSHASAIEQVAPNVFRLKDAFPADGIAELCARQKLDWTFVPED
jgi:phosphoserine phosphatase